MTAARIYFDTHDEEYFSRLGQYMVLNYPLYFNVVNDRNSGSPVYIVTDYLNKRNSKNIITIRDEGGDICKLQKASDICVEIIAIIFAGTEEINQTEHGFSKTICVTSAAGGIGKTKIAKALAVCLMNHGFRVLYINTDASSAGETITTEDKFNNLDRFFYRLKKSDSHIFLESLAETEVQTGLKCICNRLPSPENPPDKQLSKLLMKRLKSEDHFEYILIDCPSCLSEGLAEILKGSGKNILVEGNVSNKREETFLEYINTFYEEKTVEVRNMSNPGKFHVTDENTAGTESFQKSIDDLMKALEE